MSAFFYKCFAAIEGAKLGVLTKYTDEYMDMYIDIYIDIYIEKPAFMVVFMAISLYSLLRSTRLIITVFVVNISIRFLCVI